MLLTAERHLGSRFALAPDILSRTYKAAPVKRTDLSLGLREQA